jgi:hypothetical protein
MPDLCEFHPAGTIEAYSNKSFPRNSRNGSGLFQVKVNSGTAPMTLLTARAKNDYEVTHDE